MVVKSRTVTRLCRRGRGISSTSPKGRSSHYRVNNSKRRRLLRSVVSFRSGFARRRLGCLSVCLSKHGGPRTGGGNTFLFGPVLITAVSRVVHTARIAHNKGNLLPFLQVVSSSLIVSRMSSFSPRSLATITQLIRLTNVLKHGIVLSSTAVPPSLTRKLCRTCRSNLYDCGTFSGHTGAVGTI